MMSNQQWHQNVGYPEQAMHLAAATQSRGGTGWQTPVPAGQVATSVQPQASQMQAQAQETAQREPSPVTPAADVIETPNEIVVYVDTPGFEKEHLQIHADGNRVYVSGDRSEDAPTDTDEGEHKLVTERPLRVERTIPLPVDIDPDRVTASHDNGVCEIVAPKDETERRHEIGLH